MFPRVWTSNYSGSIVQMAALIRHVMFQVLDFFKAMNISFFGRSFYVNLQSSKLVKIIWAMWSHIQQSEISNLKSLQENGVDIKLAGDGRFDSRGL